ncbi:hypothetical protein DFH94DRAFT_683370 [Russula ochroleuca]|uniref:Uncharacterized protein n=1 Tax=Russula ochroleuca TaxID=152965 RepID=A0A9P5MSI9_9AGAM|nr:hypothetical protein DFH94DRAFT_683370 [Russula ochroleuca]
MNPEPNAAVPNAMLEGSGMRYIVSVVNESKEVTFMTATTRVGSKSSNIGISVLRMNGIPIGRANVSSPTTSAGYYLCFKIPDSFPGFRKPGTRIRINYSDYVIYTHPNNLWVLVQWPHVLSAENEYAYTPSPAKLDARLDATKPAPMPCDAAVTTQNKANYVLFLATYKRADDADQTERDRQT